MFIKKFLTAAIFAFVLTLTSTAAFAQGGCVYFPIPAEYQNPNATNVYRVASGVNASGAPITTNNTTIATDSTLGTFLTQPVTVPSGQGPFSICAAAGAYTLQFNTTLGGGGFFNYNIFIPPDITAMSATTSKIVDPTDPTKVIKFQASGATASTTLTLADTLAASRTVTITDPGGAANIAYANPTTAQTISNTTLTSPVIATGLTASGSASNDFSASTGTFKTSTGAVTIGGAITGGFTAAGSGSNDFSGSTGTFKTSTGVGTFGGSSNSFSGAVAITPTASLTLGTSGSAAGQVILNNGTSGTITVQPATGALGTITHTLVPVTGDLGVIQACGNTGTGNQTCAPSAATAKGGVYVGESTLSSNAATITFPAPAFTSTTTFFCVANDVTTRANPVQMIPASASTATITNTTGASDVVQWVCVGN
jgi:hypothetical protein